MNSTQEEKFREEFALKSAVQTAVIAVVVEQLIAEKSVNRTRLTNELYDLLKRFTASGGKLQNAGAICHLIELIEKPEIQTKLKKNL